MLSAHDVPIHDLFRLQQTADSIQSAVKVFSCLAVK